MHSLCSQGRVLSIAVWLLDSCLLKYQLKANPSTTEVVPSTTTSEVTKLSCSYGARVNSDRSKRIGPVFSSVEKAQDYLSRR